MKPYVSGPAGWYRHPGWWLLPTLSLFCLIYGFFFALVVPFIVVPFFFPIAVLAALVIWALPDMRHAPTRWIPVLLPAFITALVVWPDYLAISLPGLPWITLLRLTGAPLLLVLLVCASVSSSFRAEMGATLNAAPWLWKLLAAFIFLQFATIVLSENPISSAQKTFVAQMNWTAIFVASCYVFVKPGRIERYITLLWCLALWISVIAMVEARVQHVLWQDHIPSFLKVDDAQRYLNTIVRGGSGVYRVKTTFSTPLGLAEFMALLIPFMYHFIFEGRRLLIRLAAAASVALFFLVITTTDARLGMVASFAGFLLYMMLWGIMRWRRLRDSIFGAAIFYGYPVFFGAAIAATFVSGRLHNLLWGNGSQISSDDARTAQIAMGIPKILHNPFGYGPGESGNALGYSSNGFVTVDNYYLTVLLEYGVIGFLVFFGMVFVAIYYAGRFALKDLRGRDRESNFLLPISVSLTGFFIIKSVLSEQGNHPLVFMMMGMIVALVWRIQQRVAAQTAAQDGHTSRGGGQTPHRPKFADEPVLIEHR